MRRSKRFETLLLEMKLIKLSVFYRISFGEINYNTENKLKVKSIKSPSFQVAGTNCLVFQNIFIVKFFILNYFLFNMEISKICNAEEI